MVLVMGGPTRWPIKLLLGAALAGASCAGGAAASSREPDGEIAFSCNGAICIANVDGSGRRQLTHDKWINSYPAWSPDGQQIAFTGYRAGNTVVFVMNADGSRRRVLAPHGDSDALPAWSPDGHTIAYDDNRSGEIGLMSSDGTQRRQLMRRSASLPSWSPAGSTLVFVSGNGRRLALTSGDIYVAKADGKGVRRLVRNGTFPSWSPDGKEIAFLRNGRTPISPDSIWTKNASIWVMNADGGGRHRLRVRADIGGVLGWSPDGRWLTFTSDNDIYVVDADGGSPRRVAGPGDNVDPAWRQPQLG
jgi:Tol biopolymer transport system component